MQQLTAQAEAGDAEAQYRLAAEMSRAGARDAADRWLNLSAQNGCGDAIYTLATRRLYTAAGASEAAALLEKAAAAGSGIAARLLLTLSALGLGRVADEQGAINSLIALAQGGEASALRELACLLAIADSDDANIAPLIAAACESDPVAAAFGLARVRAGRPGGANLARAAAFLKRIGYPRAAALAAPEGTRPSLAKIDWDRVSRNANLAPTFDRMGERLSISPDVVLFKGAVAPEICEYVIAHSATRLGPSLVYDPTAGRMIRDPLRTSATASLSPIDLDLALIAVNRLMAAAARLPEENGEFLSVLHYAPGQQYRPHFDCIPSGPDFDRSGQRALTALLFLNDDYSGGETHFTESDMKIRGKQGDILIFSNLGTDGDIDRAARHAGLPVASGVKWLASKWFRTKKFQF